MAEFLYRITFPAGFRTLAERLARRDFGPEAVAGGDESSLLLRSAEDFREPGFAQAAAIVVASAPCAGLEEAYRTIAARLKSGGGAKELSRVFRDKAFMRSGRAERFAVRGFVRSEPTFPGAEARKTLEDVIARSTGARADSSRPDIELSVSLRDDGNAYLAAGFRTRAEPAPAAGALPRHTARLLCELSRPSADDVFLDPFMGSGSIPLERAMAGPYKLIFAGDADESRVAGLKEKLKDKRFERKRKTFFPKQLDARDLSRFEDGLFTAIVTDPPWGDWEGLGEDEIYALYSRFLAEARRTAAPGARLVLLTGRNSAAEKAIESAQALWTAEERYDVLISGKKARAELFRPR